MRRSKKNESEALAVYKAYFDSYIKGDVKTITSLLDDEYIQIGSAESEVFFNKKDALKFIHDTIDQVAGKTEMRNRILKADPLNEFVLITDLFDIYALDESEWTFYSKFRASTLMQKKEGSWKFVHQHSSIPDARTQRGENIAIEKIAAENLQLREAVKRRTVELEHKNRELEIEAALERVRNKSMSMHHSTDIGETVSTLFNELLKIGLHKTSRSGIGILDESKYMKLWSAITNPDGKIDLRTGKLDMTSAPLLKKVKTAWEKQDEEYYYELTGKELSDYYKSINSSDEYSLQVDLNNLPEKEFAYIFIFKHGIIYSFNSIPIPKEAKQIFKRFAKVFEQTYTRFLDLQKAEAQAREAQIEAALERIRSKTMAMQSSSDLLGVSMVLREQMGILGQVELESSIVHLYNNPDTIEAWYTFRSTETNSDHIVTDKGIIPVDSCEYIMETLEKYNSDETEYTIVSTGKKLVDWYNVMVKVAPDTIEYDDHGKMIVPDILYYHYSKFPGGALLMVSNEKPSDEAKELQKRAAKVFSLAYQRFLDLQQAEIQAKEAIKQASLDRVRGEIASMRSKEDLSRITPLIWQELTTLNVPFIRCGVFIMDEKQKVIQSYLSAPDNRPLGAFDLPYESNELARETVSKWRKGEIHKEHWNAKQFLKFTQKLVELGQINDPRAYQGTAAPPKSLYLNFLPFKQGMLYVGNTSPLSEDELQLVQSLADAFSIAYARYEDFKQLEEAKNQTERTLNELKSTQTQLIHAEKMASLGELTAGIAHEIQNPLNFVNNFSEVSSELVDEMKEELMEGNKEDALEIAGDLQQNLEKISHHGNRASSIVKSMLEHSRSGDKRKVLTDINKLSDEYLRLAYHGLRAKDKSFNAGFKTNFDQSLPKITVVPQDIGRVLLNLINNAFQAVNGVDEPRVEVSTELLGDKIEIRVKDNGSGIPDDIRDKIFEPFFTTKPTGKGTGLGLSMSYDILTKGHDGRLEVETELGKGTEFIILLPINN